MNPLPPLDENDRPPSNAFPERRLSLRDWFPILLLVAGFIVDLLAGAFGKIGYVNSLFARWGALIGFVAMCLAALPVIRRTVANRRFLWMLFIGSALILVHQAFNLIRKIDPIDAYFRTGTPDLVLYVVMKGIVLGGIATLVAGLYFALVEMRHRTEQSDLERRRLAREVAARERVEQELKKHQEDLEDRVAHRTEELRQEVEERKIAEKSLRESEERLHLALEGASDGVWDWDSKSEQMYLSPHWKSMLGYTEGELENRFGTFKRLIVPEDFPTAFAHFQETVAARKSTYQHEFRMKHKQGHLVDILTRTYIVYDSQGGVERVVGTNTDVTERKNYERLIFDEAQRRRILMENSQDGIVILNEACGVYEANRKFADMLGYTLDEVSNLHVWDWDTRFSREEIQSMAATVRDGFDRFETMHRRKDGSTFDVEVCTNGSKIHGDWLIFCVCRETTQRKIAERELQEREEKYRAAVETSGDGFWMTNMNGRLLEANQTYAERSGYSVEELVGMNIKDLDGQQDSQEIDDHIERIREKRQLLFESLHRTKNGSLWPVEINVSYWPIHEGRLFVFIRDVLRRKSSEALIHARMQLAELFQSSDLGELMQAALDTAEKLTESRIGYFHFVEPDQEHLTLQAWSTQTVHSGCQIQVGAHYPISQAGVWVDCFHARKPVIHNDYPNLPHKKGYPEGHSPVIREMGVPVLRDGLVVAIIGVGNKPTDYTEEDVSVLSNLASLVIDLVERKRAEEALRRSEENLRRAQEVSHTGSYTLDLLQNVFDISEEAYRIYSVPIGMTVTPEFLESELIHPEDLDWVVEAHHQAMKDGSLNIEHRLSEAHGGKWIRICSKYEKDSAGQAVRVIGTIQDITEMKKIQEERLELQQQLLHSQKLESLGILAGGIAHDFNNLLMAILGNLDLVKNDLPPTSPAFDGVEQAILATRRATDLTHQMLAYSGKGRFIIRRFDLSEMVTENANLFRASVARNVTLRVLLTPHPVPIEADPGQIQQVIMNLLTNAVEAIGDQPGVVTLSTRRVEEDEQSLSSNLLDDPRQPGHYACLRVSDNGCGMDEETQQRLFDPFFTTKFTGRGLGMSALMGIVRGHKGVIRVDSAPGQGTTIEVLFPMGAPLEKSSKNGSDQPTGGSTFAGYDLHALVVDDEDSIRRITVKYLTHLGIECTVARDGEEAIDLFREADPGFDLVLLDLTMPKKDGIATFLEMRAIQPDTRVILSSGYSEQEAIDRLEGQGFSSFLQKPYRKEDLIAKIVQVLNISPSGHETSPSL